MALTNAGSRDAVLWKLSGEGTTLWAVRWGRHGQPSSMRYSVNRSSYDAASVIDFGLSHEVATYAAAVEMSGGGQGLTLVHFSAQLQRFLRDGGCTEGLFRDCFLGS